LASQKGVYGQASQPTGPAGMGPETGRLVLSPAIRARRNRLWLPAELTLDAWSEIGLQIVAIGDSSAWWLGDWLMYGKKRFPDRYKKAVGETSLDYQTLRNYAWVCRQFPADRRRSQLSFQHHAELASLSTEEQDEWLEKAEALGWSMHELRRQLRAGGAGRRKRLAELSLNIAMTFNQQEIWRAAASASGVDIQVWITATLDNAAKEIQHGRKLRP
jgi:hypothetical protein